MLNTPMSRRQAIAAVGGALLSDGCRAWPAGRASLLDYIPASEHDAIAGHRSRRDVAAHIQTAIDECARAKAELIVPAGTYWLSPRQSLAHADPGFACHAALMLRSSLRLRAMSGARFIMVPGYSRDALPRAMVMFGSSDILGDVDIDGLTMDMNGAANPISGQRGNRIYSRLPQAHLFVSGGTEQEAARIDRCRITNCDLIGSPGVSCIVSGQSNAGDAVLGRDWLIAGNRFADNGTDTDDHSSIFGQSDDMIVRDNRFDNPVPYAGTGGNTAHEVHGARHIFDRNIVHNYLRGVWVSSSFSSATVGTRVTGNRFETLFYGVDFFRDSDRLGRISDTSIVGNQFLFDDTGFPGLDLKAAVQIASPYSQSGIEIRSNSVTKTGTALASAFLVVAQGERGPGTHDMIAARDNEGSGLTFGLFARTSRGAGLGRLTFLDNRWSGLTPAGIFAITAGCIVERTGVSQPVRSLVLGGGRNTGRNGAVPALFLNAHVRSLTLSPVDGTDARHPLVRGGADRIDALAGSLGAPAPAATRP